MILMSPNVQLYLLDSMEEPVLLDSHYRELMGKFDPDFDNVDIAWGNHSRDGPCKSMPLKAVWVGGRIRLLDEDSTSSAS